MLMMALAALMVVLAVKVYDNMEDDHGHGRKRSVEHQIQRIVENALREFD